MATVINHNKVWALKESLLEMYAKYELFSPKRRPWPHYFIKFCSETLKYVKYGNERHVLVITVFLLICIVVHGQWARAVFLAQRHNLVAAP